MDANTNRQQLHGVRRVVIGFGMAAGLLGVVPLALSWGPRINAETITAGRTLFEHKWEPNDPLAGGGDGLGPVFNATSCVACHFQGGIGGAGPNRNNVLAFNVVPNIRDRVFQFGVVHLSAVSPIDQETQEGVSQLFPIVPGGSRIVQGCQTIISDFNPVSFTQINTPALFGAGSLDRVSDGAIRAHRRVRQVDLLTREFELDFNGTPAGRPRILPGGRIGKFGWKAQFATLEEFVATACAVEIGLSNAKRAQDTPRRHTPDSKAQFDISKRQLFELAAFCDALPQPKRLLPNDSADLAQVERGERLFTTVGCADCHTANLGTVEGIYSDLLLHRMEDSTRGPGYGNPDPEVPFPDDLPLPTEWKTPPLWGVADTAPYFHDGGSATLEDAIVRHKGQAKHVTSKFKGLEPADQQAIIAFLKTLRAPDVPQVSSPVILAGGK